MGSVGQHLMELSQAANFELRFGTVVIRGKH